MDELSEQAVQTHKQYLPIYCHDRHNPRGACLPLAQFDYNTTATTTNKLSLCRSLYGFDPCTIHHDNNYELALPVTEELVESMTTVHNHIYNVLSCINHARSTLYVEKARQFNIDDWVLVDRRNLQI